MPERCPPAAPVLVRAIRVEDEPTPFHLGVAQFLAAPARHLALVEWQIHVLGGVAVEIVDIERTVAGGKNSGGKRVQPQPVQLPPLQPGVFWLDVAQIPFRYSGP